MFAFLKTWRLIAILLACNVSVLLGSDDGSFTLTILHTNDVHSHIEETSKYGGVCSARDKANKTCVGGVARIVTKVKELKKKHPDSLFMNGGDFFQGTPYYTILKHKMVSAMMTEMKYDHVCLGNHEFDDGPKGLAPFLESMKAANISVVSTNTNFSQEPYLKDKPIQTSVIIQVNQRKVGIIGAVLPQTKELSSPGNVIFYDEIKSFESEIAYLKNQGVNVIVAITHCGYLRELEIMKQVNDLDVIVGGHTNTFLYHGTGFPKENTPEGDYPTVVNKTDGSKGLVVQAYYHGKFLGFLQVAFDKDGNVLRGTGNPILLDSTVKEDEDMLKVIEPFKKNATKVINKAVGWSKVLLEQHDDICRVRECNLGNMMADAYFAHYADMNTPSPDLWSEVNAAIINGGTIRAPFPQGPITMGDILTTAPFGQTITTVTLNGTALKQMFEHSVERFSYLNRRGEFLQVSGMRVVYNLSLPSLCRVISLKTLCKKCQVPVYKDVVPEEMYTIVTIDFVAKGGDGFAKAEQYGESGPVDFDVLVKYIEKMSPIKTPIEGRIIIHGNVMEPSP
ncbi:snake venom 5'-nucleotidase [Ixodes scapularis]|uniref:snake venom 5'-nucleotidase n=1 Tax=Ixodes scapularis TaxID=6945 RepID=UPI001A9F2A26|nr:snake venom 5'-nucleotidase [Ixodes scapularis]